MALVKSYSNYVLRKKHQTVSDGTIWERDITTIGGVNQFAPGQTPIFRDNNFIITVRNDGSIAKQYNSSGWKEVADGSKSTVWTLDSIANITSDLEDQNDTKIVIKNDYYDFRDFAYYGSLAELFRSSINDIIRRFPGELYGSTENVYYVYNKEEKQLGSEGYIYHLKDPFGIDIHTKNIKDNAKSLKYFANEGFKEYTVDGDPITAWTYEESIGYCNPDCDNTFTFGDINDLPHLGVGIGGYIGTVTITTQSGETYDIRPYIGQDGDLYYMHNGSLSGKHIRPNEEYIDDFYNGCNTLQKLLMNRETTPLYKATFSVLSSTDLGFKREMEEFIFPTSDGGYNIDASSYGFTVYTQRLAVIGEFYDEYFTDNLVRSMTHEAIKNFDWTHTRNGGDDAEEYQLGAEKMQKALRLFAREFDEVKLYIDNITSVNKVTYDDRSNIPNYFLTDTCENEGWDIIQVVPFDVTLASDICKPNTYIQNTKKEVKPYNSNLGDLQNGYFITCCCNDCDCLLLHKIHLKDYLCEYGNSDNYCIKLAEPGESTYYEECTDRLHNRIKTYTNTADTYTYMDVNNEFLRRLKLNSRYIWRHKGTIEGIEMILAMFGLKSKRWIEAQTACTYDNKGWDYEITEYTRFTAPIEDKFDDCHKMFEIDWVNSTKTITYDYRTVSIHNPLGSNSVTYVPYQGIPVAYDDRDNKRYLYPNFNKTEQYDGNPYFQMNGGWLSKQIKSETASYYFQFANDNTPVYDEDTRIYKETVRNIRRVENLNQLLSLPSSQLEDGSICFVERINNDLVAIDGEVFDIHTDRNGKKYVTFVRKNGIIKVGGKYFNESISVYASDGVIHSYDLVDKLDGYPVDAYFGLKDGASDMTSFYCANTSENTNYSIDYFHVIETGDTDDTNYFVLDNVDFSNTLDNRLGWRRLKTTDKEYKRINTIWNYYKGNNPHSGNMNYDNGEEYYEYFKHLFKYAYENDLFDERCYESYYADIDDYYEKAGFKNITADAADTKIHYFGNYLTSDGTKYIYGADDYKFINTNNPYTTQLKTDSITNQIINNKRLTIKFKIGYKYWTKDGQTKLKFIDEVVMSYLTQLIPSTTIVDIEYEFTSVPTETEIQTCCKLK